VQVDPIKPMLEAPGTKRLELEHDEPLSKCAFKFQLRRYHLWTAKFDDPWTNYSSWMAGEEHQIGDAYDISISQVSYGALVVYDSDADGRVLHLSTDQLNLARIIH